MNHPKKPFALMSCLVSSALAALPLSSSMVLAEPSATPDELFDWAERTYPNFFVSGSGTYSDGYIYRAYANNIYLGTSFQGQIVLMTPQSNVMQGFGLLTQFTCEITPAAIGCPDAPKIIPIGTPPDTGITLNQCFHKNSKNTLNSCSSSMAIPKQDGALGLDVSAADDSDGRLGFSYARLSTYALTECVRDQRTNLIWEGKPNDGRFRDASNTYTSIGHTDNDVHDYVKAVNAQGLCGYHDWRLPTPYELQTLVDYGAVNAEPMIDKNWFPNTNASRYWTNAFSYKMNAYLVASTVDFGTGVIDQYPRKNNSFVRLVRGNASLHIPKRYTYATDGTEVIDTATGLTWKRCPEGQTWNGHICYGIPILASFEEALMLAESNSGWRLPNIKEINTIADTTYHNQVLDPSVFPNVPKYVYWSSTPVVKRPDLIWLISFGRALPYVFQGTQQAGGQGYVWLVR